MREVSAKHILNKTGIPGFTYCLNPYVGCRHACVYCYAALIMMRFRPCREPWGSFVDVKINTPLLLAKEIERAKKGRVYMSSVTDCYQPAERKYGLTRKSLEILLEHQVPLGIQTKSPLVLRDLDLIRAFEDIEVGITITTNDENIRKLFEPGAPPVLSRISALRRLHQEGIRNYVFIGPILPLDAEKLVNSLGGFVDCILVDRMNYTGQVRSFYRKFKLERFLEDAYFEDTAGSIRELGGKLGIEVEVLF